MSTPPWLDQAWLEFGQSERPGNADNPRIVALYRDAGHPEVTHDETAWCAAFVGASLFRAGFAGTGQLLARSYAHWGTDAQADRRLGAIAVLSRGGDPSLGHVGFLLAETPRSLILLGGNQGDSVSVASYDRSRLVALRWPASEAAGTSNSAVVTPVAVDSSDNFDGALRHVLEMEGGFTDDAGDPGGPTNRGITLAEFAAWRGVSCDGSNRQQLIAALKAISDSDVRAIYRDSYWKPSACPQLPDALALMHFDAAVNQGVGTAMRLLQQAVETAPDGVWGPETEAAVARSAVPLALRRYADLRRARYRSLSGFTRFGRGWLNRVDTTLARALALAAPTTEADRRNIASGPSSRMSQSPTSKIEDAMTEAAADVSAHTTSPNTPSPIQSADTSKWWGQSLTIWGTALTAVSTVLPLLAPLFGFEISAETVRQLGGQAASVVQGAAGLIGSVMAIYGRSRASQPLERRAVSLRL